MLAAGGHAQILVPEKQGHGVNIGTLHPELACGGVAQFVKAKVFNTQPPQ
jgi:hypothetical protein